MKKLKQLLTERTMEFLAWMYVVVGQFFLIFQHGLAMVFGKVFSHCIVHCFYLISARVLLYGFILVMFSFRKCCWAMFSIVITVMVMNIDLGRYQLATLTSVIESVRNNVATSCSWL
jgi:hypothetical protein